MNVSNEYLTTWFQFEFSDPPEIGLTQNGLRKFRIDYANDNIELSVGDIYKIWGRGLIINQFDDQDVDLDNGYRGLSFGLIEENYNMNLIAGLSNVSSITSDFVYGLDLEYEGSKLFSETFFIWRRPRVFTWIILFRYIIFTKSRKSSN